MKDVIHHENAYYIRANSSLVEEKTHVLKHNDMFAIFNQNGSIRTFGFENHGVYFEGTRFLSRLVMHINEKHPLLLSSTIKEQNEVLAVDFTNPDIEENSHRILKDQIHFFNYYFLKDQCCYIRFRITNYGLLPVTFDFAIDFEADFRDIFEVRGLTRPKRGILLPAHVTPTTVELGYQGLDPCERRTFLDFSPAPTKISAYQAQYHLELKPNQHHELYLRIACDTTERHPPSRHYDAAMTELKEELQHFQNDCRIHTSDEHFNNWLGRSSADLSMMLTQTKDGLYPYAGIPWFSTVFGRDGLITAWETLWIYPQIAKGVLQYLSHHQARHQIPEQDAEPGKILHEVRGGEMANLKEIPFGLYYGSIDSTLLYLILAGHYYQRSADKEFLRDIWPSLLRALEWVGEYGDVDKDGFVEYVRKASGGLGQQGWKDSEDSVFHADGALAQAPIALCEVQGYVYEAKRQMAILALELGEKNMNLRLLREADDLRERFMKSFWCEGLDFLALALDAEKKPCRVLSSNAGQCLLSGIVPPGAALKIQKRLMSRPFFSGWGVRTIAQGECRYNPMSYHNGSVWPHDNALIAYGLNRYGFKDSVNRIMTGLFESSMFMDLNRLPELFCGFERRPNEGPTLFPVACNPQSWASASIYMLLQCCMGLSIDAKARRITFEKPHIPSYLEEINIRNLKVGNARLDINVEYNKSDVDIKVMDRKGKVEVVIIK